MMNYQLPFAGFPRLFGRGLFTRARGSFLVIAMAMIDIRGGRQTNVAKLGKGNNRGAEIVGYAIVNDEIAGEVNRHSWSLSKSGYPKTRLKDGEDIRFGQKDILLHIFVYRVLWGFGVGDGEEVDHIDRNKLNSLDSNLRRVTISVNKANSSTRKDNTSGYRGVNKRSDNGLWRSSVACRGVRRWVGQAFKSAVEAARAANEVFSMLFPGVTLPNPHVKSTPFYTHLRILVLGEDVGEEVDRLRKEASWLNMTHEQRKLCQLINKALGEELAIANTDDNRKMKTVVDGLEK